MNHFRIAGCCNDLLSYGATPGTELFGGTVFPYTVLANTPSVGNCTLQCVCSAADCRIILNVYGPANGQPFGGTIGLSPIASQGATTSIIVTCNPWGFNGPQNSYNFYGVVCYST